MGLLVDKIKYLDAWTASDAVKLSYRDGDGRLRYETIEDYCLGGWYFYITMTDYELLGSEVVSGLEAGTLYHRLSDVVRFEVDGKNWVRVYVTNKNLNERYSNRADDTKKIKKLFGQNGVKCFEADLKPHKRYCIDENIQVADNYKILYYDIETDDRNPGIVIGRDQILTIAAVNQDGEEFFFHDENEEVLLQAFHDFVRWDYDILVGYNSDNFDKPYILARYKEHFMDDAYGHFRFRVIHLDLMQIFIKRFAGESDITSWSLDFISKYFLGHGKLDGGPKFGSGRGYEYYQTNFDKFKEYNIMDARNLYDLNVVLNIVDQIILECQITGCFPSKSSISELLDCFILRSVRDKGIHFASIEYSENQIRCPKCNHVCQTDEPVEEIVGAVQCTRCSESFDPNTDIDIAGAFVFDPVCGNHDDVYVFDYKALYPSIIRTWNIGPDTFLEPNDHDKIHDLENWHHYLKSANDQYYETPERSVSTIKSAVEQLLDLRKKYKTEMMTYKAGSTDYKAFNAKQNAVKMLCNSMYGLMGYKYGRFYRKEIAEAITLGGQWLNKHTKKWFEKKGHDVIYGDTDSVFVRGNNLDRDGIDDLLMELHEFYDDALDENFGIKKHFIELEFEKRFGRLLLIKKKNYVGQLIELDGKTVDKFIVKGLECIKRDTIPLGKKWQRELVEMLIKEDNPSSFYHSWIQERMNAFHDGDFELEDIIVRKKLTKHPNKYKTRNIHAMIAMKMMSLDMECYVGMPIPYIVTEDKPSVFGVHPDWYKEGTASISYYWDAKIYALLQRVLEVALPKDDWGCYSSKITASREKKRVQFTKWFQDPKKIRSKTLQKLNADKILSKTEKIKIKREAGIRTLKAKVFKEGV